MFISFNTLEVLYDYFKVVTSEYFTDYFLSLIKRNPSSYLMFLYVYLFIYFKRFVICFVLQTVSLYLP